MTSYVKPRLFILLSYGHGANSWQSKYERGETWDPSPYGYDRALSDFDIRWSQDSSESLLQRTLRKSVRRLLGFDLVHVWRNRGLLGQADAVWTHTEYEHLAVAALQLVQVVSGSVRVLGQSVWLWDRYVEFSAVRRLTVRRLLRQIDVEAVHSRINRDLSKRTVPGRRVIRVPFGTTPPPVQRRSGAGGFVLVPGNDRHRDWARLIRVAKRLPDLQFVIAANSTAILSSTIPENVTVTQPQGGRISQLYADCALVVVPLLPNTHASGLTVSLEALSLGVPLVVSNEGGIDDYLRDTPARLVSGSDDDALAEAVLEMMEDDPVRPSSLDVLLERGISQSAYVDRFVAITKAILDGSEIPPEVEDFYQM